MELLLEFGKGDQKLIVRSEEVLGITKQPSQTQVLLRSGELIAVAESYETARAKLTKYVEDTTYLALKEEKEEKAPGDQNA